MTKKVFFNDKVIFFTTENLNFQENEHLIIVPIQSYKQFNYLFLQLSVIEAPLTIVFLFESKEKLKKIINSYFVKINAAGGLVKNEIHQYLIIKRWDKWDLPKGKMEENESAEIAAQREIEEETGVKNTEISGKLCNTLHIYKQNDTWMLKKTRWFEMSAPKDETLQPQLNEHITEVKWFDSEELKEVYKNTFRSLLEVFIAAKLKAA